MFRTVVILLIAWPLLLPPGACVCDWLTSGTARAGQVADEQVCPCGCRHDLEDAAAALAQADDSGEQPADHVPACPARNDVSQWKANPVQPYMPAADLDLLGLVLPVEEAIPGVPEPAEPRSAGLRDCPIYLSLLTLRI